MRQKIILFVILLLLSNISCYENNSIKEVNSIANYKLEELKNDSIIESCEEIYKWRESTKWKKVKRESTVRLDGSHKDKWFRFHFKNLSKQEKEWYLILKWTTLDFVEFCSPLYEKSFETQFSGIQTPYEKWAIHTYFPTFRFWLEPMQENVYYLRVQSAIPLAVPIRILHLNDFLRQLRKITAINFLFFGFGVLYIFYNFFHYFESRDNIYLYNNIFVIFMNLTILSRFGIAYEFFWKESPVWQSKAVDIFLGIAVFGALEFTRRFLHVNKFYNKMDLGFEVLSVISILYSIFAFSPVSKVYLSRFFAGFFVLIIIYVVASVIRVIIQKNYKPAKLFLAALIFFLVTAMLNFIFHLNLWDYNRYWIYTFMFFIPISFVFVSFSLGERVKEIKKENAKHKSEIQIILEKLKEATEDKPKYAKTQLAGIDLNKVTIKLIHLMENEKIYYNENLNLQTLAEMLDLSRHQLSEILNRVLSINFNEFVQNYRIQEAKELIKNRTELNILNIAFEVGFQSKSTFNSAFKKKTGYTPIEYKNLVERNSQN